MANGVSDKPVTLGGLILKAQKEGKSLSAVSGALEDSQTKLADTVSLSAGARAKIDDARKVDAHLRVFGAFVKLLNAPQYGISPAKYGLEETLGKIKNSLFNREV